MSILLHQPTDIFCCSICRISRNSKLTEHCSHKHTSLGYIADSICVDVNSSCCASRLIRHTPCTHSKKPPVCCDIYLLMSRLLLRDIEYYWRMYKDGTAPTYPHTMVNTSIMLIIPAVFTYPLSDPQVICIFISLMVGSCERVCGCVWVCASVIIPSVCIERPPSTSDKPTHTHTHDLAALQWLLSGYYLLLDRDSCYCWCNMYTVCMETTAWSLSWRLVDMIYHFIDWIDLWYNISFNCTILLIFGFECVTNLRMFTQSCYY